MSAALVAMDLHEYHTAFESLFDRIARAIDGDVSSGPESHGELLDQMSVALPPTRPAVDPAKTFQMALQSSSGGGRPL